MTTLTITGSVTRAELSLGDLSLESSSYRIVRLYPGSREWDRQTVESRYTHGSRKVGSVLRHGSLGLTLRCYGSSVNNLEVAVADMVNAFSQGSYSLSVGINGVDHEWDCWEADIDFVDGEYNKFLLMSYMQEYNLTVPRHPNPLAGPL